MKMILDLRVSARLGNDALGSIGLGLGVLGSLGLGVDVAGATTWKTS